MGDMQRGGGEAGRLWRLLRLGGETETKYSYDKAVCETMGKDIDDISGTCLDVAHVKWGSPYLKWGGAWRMPTKDEFDELENKCIFEMTEHNGVKGYKFTSKINGNSIFLPAAGNRVVTARWDFGKKGLYWSSTQIENSDSHQKSHYLSFTDREIETSSTYYSGYGFSVRPVAEYSGVK